MYVGYQDNKFMAAIESDCLFSFIKPNTNLKSMRLWTNYYLRFDRTVPKGDLFGESDIWAWNMCETSGGNSDVQLSSTIGEEISAIEKLQLELQQEKLKNEALMAKLKALES